MNFGFGLSHIRVERLVQGLAKFDCKTTYDCTLYRNRISTETV